MSFGIEQYGSEGFFGVPKFYPVRANTVQISSSVTVGGDPQVPDIPAVPYEPRWLDVGHAAALVPFDNQSGAWMFDLLPEWYRTNDANTPGHPGIPEMVDWGQLRRFLEILGQMYDNLRSEIETIAEVYDPGTVRVDLLRQFSEMMGFPFERNIGAAPMRTLLANWFYILKYKGTYDATLRFVESITNYPATIEVGNNMVLTTNDGQGTESSGFWRSTGNDLVYPVEPNNPYLATCQTALQAQCVSDAATPQPMSYIDADTSTARTVKLTAIPLMNVNARHYYSIVFRWFDTVPLPLTPTLTIAWYDENGIYLSTTSQLGQPVGDGVWAVSSISAIPPTSAQYAVLGWTLPFPGAGKRLRFTGVCLCETAGPYFPPRNVGIVLYPTRVNYFPNPNFESGALLFFEQTNAQYTATWTTEQANPLTYASHAMKVVLDPTVTSVFVTSASIGPAGPIVVPEFVPGDVWSFMISVLPGQPPGDERLTPFITVTYEDGSSEMIMVEVEEPNLGFTWTQLICSTEVPADGLDHITVGVLIEDGPIAGNSVYYFDSVSVERNAHPYFYGYFDGNLDQTSADFIWAADESDSPSMYFPNRYMRDQRLRALLPDFLPPLCAFDITYALPTS